MALRKKRKGEAPGPVGLGVIGLGFMGREHVRAWRAAEAEGLANALVAVCDPDRRRLTGRAEARGNIESPDAGPLFDPSRVRGYTRAEDLLADAAVKVVSICTPTDSHVELALAALAAGKHVLVEKPLALREHEVSRLAAAARAARDDRRLVCLPAMCMRFWPGWSWLATALAERRFGPVRSAVFRRLGTRPAWSPFYADPGRSGGALFDLHVHDADFVPFLFGMPRAVTSTGSADHVTTLYHYDPGRARPGGPPAPGVLAPGAHVVAEGGWDHADGFGFRMTFTVVCERATLDFDLGRPDRLLLVRDGAAEAVALPAGTGYDGEVRHLLALVSALRAGREPPPPRATVDEAVEVTRLLAAEAESLRRGGTVEL